LAETKKGAIVLCQLGFWRLPNGVVMTRKIGICIFRESSFRRKHPLDLYGYRKGGCVICRRMITARTEAEWWTFIRGRFWCWREIKTRDLCTGVAALHQIREQLFARLCQKDQHLKNENEAENPHNVYSRVTEHLEQVFDHLLTEKQ